MAPKPLAAGRELIAARAFGPVCPQRDDRYAPQSADCLFLNIWTPAAGPRANRPVMLHIPGHAHSNGSVTDPPTEGHAHAARGGGVGVACTPRTNAFGTI